MPRSARWRDGEYLAARNHEVIRTARMLDLGKSCLKGGLEDGSRVVGAQLKPGTQPRLLIIWCIVGELDAEVSATGKADNEHRLIDARKLNVQYRAPQDRFKALSQFPAPVRAHEDMQSDHDVAGPFLPILEPSAEHCSPAARPDHDVLSCRRPGVLRRVDGSVRSPRIEVSADLKPEGDSVEMAAGGGIAGLRYVAVKAKSERLESCLVSCPVPQSASSNMRSAPGTGVVMTNPMFVLLLRSLGSQGRQCSIRRAS